MKPLLIKLFCFTSTLIALSGCATSHHAKKTPTKSEKVGMLLNIASASLSEGDATGALITLNEAKDLNSSLPELHFLYALAYYKKSELRLATESARTAVSLDSKYSQAKNTLGKLLLDQGQLKEAETYLQEAAQDLTNRDAYIAQTNLGILYSKQGRSEKALAILNQALKNGGGQACVAAYYRGQIELEKNELFKAQEDFTQSSKLSCAGLTDAHLALGKTFIRLKKYDQARAKFIEIQQFFPHSDAATTAHQLMGEIP